MDTELKCNRLTCRRPLTDKAVVTTCMLPASIECANELFNAARLCPACETSLSEPDDVVVSHINEHSFKVCSLHPSNDYKTSVLSGLTPSIILEICSRAISFWQYQIHQENSFQQAVVRSVNDKVAQLQKQVDNVVREANAEINLISNKYADCQRDLELEHRKVRDLQEAAREKDKEYQKLKVCLNVLHIANELMNAHPCIQAQLDKIKRKALFAHNAPIAPATGDEQLNKRRSFASNSVDLGAVVGGMEACGVHTVSRIFLDLC
ncbi:hypothetical protein B0H15DRAFT_775222 [Mycena belliarum]|uniref:RING-type domain-containing protein n=1 Tax=Mycena belliarum TaxID=1033014 RepID=A0AAD6U9S5_9AGAR|nr:hypothetical protein B0H15DRAFT_775222 [Mycena belliae]